MERVRVSRAKTSDLQQGKPAVLLLSFDLIQSRTESETKKIVDAIHEALALLKTLTALPFWKGGRAP
jgi:hypothetical protein